MRLQHGDRKGWVDTIHNRLAFPKTSIKCFSFVCVVRQRVTKEDLLTGNLDVSARPIYGANVGITGIGRRWTIFRHHQNTDHIATVFRGLLRVGHANLHHQSRRIVA